MNTITVQLSEHPIPPHMVEAAAHIVTAGQVERVATHTYRVRDYTVTIVDGHWTCDCQSTIRCKHMLAALHIHTET